MQLEDYIEFLLAGGPGSGCHGPNCGRPTGSSETRRGLRHAVLNVAKDVTSRNFAMKAVDIMSKQRVDERLFSTKPLKQFVHGSTDSEWNVAMYLFRNAQGSLLTYERASALDVVHELGHHLDYSWLKDAARDRESDTIDSDKVKSVMRSIEKEYQAARDKVMEKFPGKNIKDVWSEVPARGVVSGYSLYNKEEWFAESFLHYFTNPDKLHKVAPETYKGLRTILSGEIFKPKRKAA